MGLARKIIETVSTVIIWSITLILFMDMWGKYGF